MIGTETSILKTEKQQNNFLNLFILRNKEISFAHLRKLKNGFLNVRQSEGILHGSFLRESVNKMITVGLNSAVGAKMIQVITLKKRQSIIRHNSLITQDQFC